MICFMRSTFYRSCSNTGEEEPLECQEYDDDGNYGDGGHGKQVRPVDLQLPDEIRQRLLDGLLAVVGDDDQRPQVVVPTPHEAENGNGGNNGLAHGENQAEKNSVLPRPIDAGRFDQRVR